MEATMVITAVFPLGVFLGHEADGRPSDFPTNARLHSALVNSAGQGSAAELVNGRLQPSARSVEALEWLERNPPEAIAHPETVRVATGTGVVAWRDEGVITKTGGRPSVRKVGKPQSDGVAAAGSFAWVWTSPVPQHIRDTLEMLCGDVSCLGESDSPALIEVSAAAQANPTHLLEVESGFPSPGGLRVRTPLAGRTAALEEDYTAAHPTRRPSVAADRPNFNTLPSSHAPTSVGVRDRIYREVGTAPAPLPWTRALVFRTGDLNLSKSAVLWAVAFHRALASRLGDDAPSIVTGRYADGALKPPNRVAIQVASPHPARAPHLHPDESALLVLLPDELEPAELASIDRSLKSIRNLYCSEGSVELEQPQIVAADRFWSLPEPGHLRLWRPYPSLVPEVRQLPSKHDRQWTLSDAAALSVGFVFREQFEVSGSTRHDRYRDLARAVNDLGVRVHEPHPIRPFDPRDHVHRAPKSLTVQPMTALVNLGGMVPDSALFALGQSRHLGGGLMVPEDVPAQLARQRGLG